MSDCQTGVKRSKAYYKKCQLWSSKKQKKINDLDIGMKGFLVTCNMNEREAVREAYNILNEYADKIYGPEDNKDSSECTSDEDMEKAMAKETEALKQARTSLERRFQNTNTKTNNLIFIRTTLTDPRELVHEIFQDLSEKRVQKVRYAMRMIPVIATCRAKIKAIEDTAKELFKPHFETAFGIGRKFAIVCKIRSNQSISREAVMPTLGRLIREMNPLHVGRSDTPELVVIVEIIRNICCLSVVTDYFQFRKFNFHEIVTNPDGKKKVDYLKNESENMLDAPEKDSNNSEELLVENVGGTIVLHPEIVGEKVFAATGDVQTKLSCHENVESLATGEVSSECLLMAEMVQ